MSLPASAPLVRSESVVFTELDDEVVMLDVKSGQYYELDAIGARIWVLLEDKPSMTALRDALTAEYDVDGETCLKDLDDFIGNLAQLGLVAAAPDESADA